MPRGVGMTRITIVEDHELFAESPEGVRPLWQPATRELMITWGKD